MRATVGIAGIIIAMMSLPASAAELLLRCNVGAATMSLRIDLDNSTVAQTIYIDTNQYRANITRDLIVWRSPGAEFRVDRISGDIIALWDSGKPWSGRCFKAEGL